MNFLVLTTIFPGDHILLLPAVISGAHIVILLAALLLLFGGKKIPELMGGIGKGIKEFKKASKVDDESNNASKEMPKDETKKE
jgi:sec-independent protein translocase protein TatA